MASVTVAAVGPVTRARAASAKNPGSRTGTAMDTAGHPENHIYDSIYTTAGTNTGSNENYTRESRKFPVRFSSNTKKYI